MFEQIRELWTPARGRIVLGIVLFIALLLPGYVAVRSSNDAPPEPIETSNGPPSARSIEPLPIPDEPSVPAALVRRAPLLDLEEIFDRAAEPTPTPLVLGMTLEAPPPAPPPSLPANEAEPEPDAPAATELLGIEVSPTSSGDGSLIRLHANGTVVKADSFALENPDRLVIDLPDLVNTLPSSVLTLDSPFVARARVGEHDGMVRVVLDSRSGAEAFEGRLVEFRPDGLSITLGGRAETGAAPGVQGAPESESQPVASIAPPEDPATRVDASRASAKASPELPLYLLGDGTSERHASSSPAPEGQFDCIIEPFEVVEVGSALTAVVASVEVERSDFVKTGQVLADLEASPKRAATAVARARATMEGDLLARQARMKLGWRKQKRADQLFEREALSADMRDEILTEAEVAKAVLQEAREQKELMELEYQEAVERLEEHTIRSPIDGVVVERLKSPGEVVKEETIVVLAQIDPLRVEVILPAAEFGSVRAGMRAEVTPETPNAGLHVASVSVVDRVVDGTSGTFGVRLELPNPDLAVPSGLRCKVRFLRLD